MSLHFAESCWFKPIGMQTPFSMRDFKLQSIHLECVILWFDIYRLNGGKNEKEGWVGLKGLKNGYLSRWVLGNFEFWGYFEKIGMV
jgi:hypothetical protein